MRKIIVLAATILAGTHIASSVINQYPSEHYYAPPLQKIAQGWWRYGDPGQNFPRHDEPPPWDRPWQGPYREPNAGIYDPEFRDPMDEDLNRFRRRRQFNRVQPFHPY
jgi:hypothetical protein